MMVDIYLFTPGGSRPKDTHYEYLLSCEAGELSGGGYAGKGVTAHQTALCCAISALGRMKKGGASVITVHTDCGYLASGRGNLAKWRENGWKRSDGGPVKNEALWQQLLEAEKPHAVRYVREAGMIKYREKLEKSKKRCG